MYVRRVMFEREWGVIVKEVDQGGVRRIVDRESGYVPPAFERMVVMSDFLPDLSALPSGSSN